MSSHSVGSSPQGDAIGGSPTSSQAKRAACDRCRGQKLRCVREDRSGNPISGKCIRCATAGSTCSFSKSKRAGRPPASGTTSCLERRGKGKTSLGGLGSTRTMANKSGQNGFDERPKDDRFGLQLGENSDELRLERTATGRDREVGAGRTTSADDLVARPLNPPSMHESSNALNGEHLAFSTYLGSSNANMPWSDEGMTAFYDGGDPTNLDPFGPEYSWTFPQAQTQPMEIQVPNTTSAGKDCQVQDTGLDENNTTHGHLRRSNVQITNSPRLPASLTYSSGSAHSFDSTRTLDSQVGSRIREREEPINFSIFTPKSASQNDLGEKRGIYHDNPLSVDDTQHRRMQELSELGMNLYSQLVADETHLQGTTGSPGLQDQFVGNVVKSSATFLALLTSFYPATRISVKTLVFTSSDGDGSLSEASEFGDFATDERSQSHQWKHSVASSVCKDDSKPVPADMTTIFALLTCYIRIIHLHSILYSRIYDYLTASPRKDAPLAPVFPGMQVGGVSLDDFGTFQVKLLLQISTHILGEIEMTLGLPEGYRISKKNSQSQGILETSVSVQFVEMTMRENGRTGLGIKRDRVTSIRDNLVSLRRLLKGTINI